MRKIMILDEKDLASDRGDWKSSGEDVFLLQPYNTITCLQSSDKYEGGVSVADFVKYILSRQPSC